MDVEDRLNEATASMRLSMTSDENGLIHIQEYHDSLNISRKLYDLIKERIKRANELFEESKKTPPEHIHYFQ